MRMAEVRRDERVRAFLRARIIFNSGSATVDCVVKNLSANGAKIEVSDAVAIPVEFELDVPQRNRVYRARLMWRDAGAIGVRFTDDTPAIDNDTLEHRLVRLERENKKLKSTIVNLTKRLERLGQDVSAPEV